MQLTKYDYLNLAAECLIGVVSILGNGLVLYAIFKNKNLRTITNYLIASLAAADFLVGLVGIPCVVVNYMGLPHDFYGCLFMSCMIVIATEISIFSLLTIGIERFLAIRYPMRHRQWLSGEIAAGVIAAVWFSGVVVGLVPMFGWHLEPQPDIDFVCSFIAIIDMNYMVYFNFLGFVLSPLVLLFLAYGYIFHVVRRRSKTTAGLSAGGNTSVQLSQAQTLKKESKAAKLIFFVLVMFTACWLPIHIMNCITLWFGKTNIPGVIVAVLLSHANSCANPFLYAASNIKFRKAFMAILRIRSMEVAPDRQGAVVQPSLVAARGPESRGKRTPTSLGIVVSHIT